MRRVGFLLPEDGDVATGIAETAKKFSESNVGSGPERGFERAQFTKMSELGFSGATVPETLGGLDLTTLQISILLFEIARRELAPAIYLSVHQMVSKIVSKFGTGAALEKFIGQLASGQALGAFCLTEASAGSDAAALKTTAQETSDGFILNGEKIYITSAGNADLYLVFARTSADLKNGISAFLITKDASGISFGEPEKKMGCEGSPIANVTLTDCFVPKTQLVGGLGEGYKIALSGLTGGRISIASCACGLASRALELAQQHASERVQFGKSISEFQGIQFMLADMWMKTRAAILMTRDAAQTDAAHALLHASAAKCFATDRAMEVTTDAVQILGGAGYLKDYEVERLMRDAKMLQIVEGTNQIQRIVIAREILRD